ncbi:MAG: hypothetical protein WB779_12820 [Ignavibacteriaceae bacterium]|jgi:hypothetical protein
MRKVIIKGELWNFRLPKVTQEFSLRGALKTLNIWLMHKGISIDLGLEKQKRGNILNYKNRMSNFLELIIMRS